MSGRSLLSSSKLLHILELRNVGCKRVPYKSSLTEAQDGQAYVNYIALSMEDGRTINCCGPGSMTVVFSSSQPWALSVSPLNGFITLA